MNCRFLNERNYFMANNKTTKSTTSKAKQTDVNTEEAAKKSYRTVNNLDSNTYVTVKNGYNGVLVYKSKRTGERYVFDGFGAEQEMELSELKSARNSSKAFFINNWFLFDDPEVIDWLGVNAYYKHALNAQSFDEVFNKTPAQIKKIVSELSKGQKRSLAFRAKQLINDEVIDSIKVINALEESLDVTLIER